MMEDEQPPTPLPGKSSTKLIAFANFAGAAAGLSTLLLLGAPFMGRFRGFYIGISGISMALCIALMAAAGLVGFRKQRREIEAGYTTSSDIWAQKPYLWGLDYRDLRVVRPPIQPDKKIYGG